MEKADNLKAFFAENAIKSLSVEYVASKRFVDKDGNPIPWKIRPINDAKNDEIVRECQRKETVPGTREVKINTDMKLYATKLICACVEEPNLNDAGLQASYSAVGAADVLQKMLLPGEATDLFLAVQEVNGFQTGMDEKVKRAKN